MLSSFLKRQVPVVSPANGQQKQQLLLGWSDGSRPESFGFTPGVPGSFGKSRAVIYDGDAPLLTCAPTGAGKGRGLLIPNLLSYPGSVIVMDIKGELFQVTSRRRRKMGNQIIALDPWHLVTEQSDSLDLFDLASSHESVG
jgi:type IV secretion system protein VirD4